MAGGDYVVTIEEPAPETPCECDSCDWEVCFSDLAEIESAVLDRDSDEIDGLPTFEW